MNRKEKRPACARRQKVVETDIIRGGLLLAVLPRCSPNITLTRSKLIKKIHEEEAWAIRYLLSTQGRGRGYGKEKEGGNPAAFNGRSSFRACFPLAWFDTLDSHR
jgi:hypothetical protein